MTFLEVVLFDLSVKGAFTNSQFFSRGLSFSVMTLQGFFDELQFFILKRKCFFLLNFFSKIIFILFIGLYFAAEFGALPVASSVISSGITSSSSISVDLLDKAFVFLLHIFMALILHELHREFFKIIEDHFSCQKAPYIGSLVHC